METFLFLLRYSFLSLVRHRWVFLLTLLGVSTGTAVVSAVFLANKSALRSFQNAVSHVEGKTDYSIRSPAGVLFSDRILDRLERLSPAPPLSLSPLLNRTVRYDGNVFWIRGVDFLAADHFLQRYHLRPVIGSSGSQNPLALGTGTLQDRESRQLEISVS